MANFLSKRLAKVAVSLWLLSGCDDVTITIPPSSEQKTEAKTALKPVELQRVLYGTTWQFDPHFVQNTAQGALLRDLLVGLVAFNAKGETVPAIADEWFSEDGKKWQFILKETARWSNDEPVTAADFMASWQRLSNPQYRSPLAHYLIYMGVENAKAVIAGEKPVSDLGVQALNEHTLQITLQQPNYQLPRMLAHLALLPTYQGLKPEAEQVFISNGSYKIAGQTKDKINLQAIEMDTPFQQVVYRLAMNGTTLQNTDIVENPTENHLPNSVKLPRLCTYFYEFNFADPIMRKREVRQAIRAMVSSAEISQDLGMPNHLVLPKTMLSEQERQLSTASSEQLLHQLGIEAGQPIKISLTYDNQGQHAVIAERIGRTLGQSDLFRVSLQPVDWQQLLEQREQKAFQLIRSGWCADYDDPLLFLNQFHSASPDNKSNYKNEIVDKQLEQLHKEALTKEQRDQLILNIVYQLEYDVAILPLFQYQRKMVIDPSIRGVNPLNASEVIYSKDLYRQE
ncbi:peptide ABC transporter substrate-binding protein [Glaesserella sp.]|uniref:peptide ABC transporter substrate-binding protein n=1 Tax=Glaesserella sp. TaxID=2094731 RepID=UPI0035A19707